MGLTLGWDALLARSEEALAAQQAHDLCNKTTIAWSADMVQILYLEDMEPIFDPTMYRIYAAMFNKTDRVTDQEAYDLAQAYSFPIRCCVKQKLLDRLYAIVNRWNAVDLSTHPYVLGIPAVAQSEFKNLITYNKIHPEGDNTSQITSLLNTMRRACTPKNAPWRVVPIPAESRLSVDEFRQFIAIVRQKLDLCHTASNMRDEISRDIRTKIQTAIEHIKAMLLLVRTVDLDGTNMIRNLAEGYPALHSAAGCWYHKYHDLLKSHVVCLEPGMDIELPSTEKFRFRTLPTNDMVHYNDTLRYLEAVTRVHDHTWN